MPQDIQFWILIFFFLVLPALNFVLRKLTEARQPEPPARRPARRPPPQPAGIDDATGQRRGLQDVLREIVEEQQREQREEEWADEFEEDEWVEEGEWEKVPPVPAPPPVPVVTAAPQSTVKTNLTGKLVSDDLVQTSRPEDWAQEEERKAFLGREQLRSKKDLRRILAWREVLDKPLALRD